jgi:hypothetical protein
LLSPRGRARAGKASAAMQYFVVMIDYGRCGREAIVDPEITRREVVSRVASGEYKNISFIREIADSAVNDVGRDCGRDSPSRSRDNWRAELQADSFDHHARDLAKHEAV